MAIESLEEAWVAFLDHAKGELAPRRALEDRICFYAGAIAGLELARSGKAEAADLDIRKFQADLDRLEEKG